MCHTNFSLPLANGLPMIGVEPAAIPHQYWTRQAPHSLAKKRRCEDHKRHGAIELEAKIDGIVDHSFPERLLLD